MIALLAYLIASGERSPRHLADARCQFLPSRSQDDRVAEHDNPRRQALVLLRCLWIERGVTKPRVNIGGRKRRSGKADPGNNRKQKCSYDGRVEERCAHQVSKAKATIVFPRNFEFFSTCFTSGDSRSSGSGTISQAAVSFSLAP